MYVIFNSMSSPLFNTLPAIDPLTFPDAVFQGDTVVVDLKGRNLSAANQVRTRPAKGITCTLGNPSGQKVVHTADTLTITVEIDPKTPPGEKYLWVQAPTGDSNQLLFIVMM
ncbi:hypothetical protein [Candidatus Cyanaurora vandensis]|uniref:hypothetical protein n=1 Tax=Candidatus Cyanaurora vandensis TaxID=2714958 RepID=UPI002580B206|nr:hypothetical protein [Candidatus Cyanaurora vandensis]